MCGICLIASNKGETTQIFKKFEDNLKRRGPDNYNTKVISGNYNLVLAASVLWLQGDSIVKQPLETDDYLFLYNGDIYDYNVGSDTYLFLEKFSKNAFNFLNSNYGPYAFILYDKKEKTITFGRDKYGRKSLLLGKKDDNVVITSVAARGVGRFIELPSIGTFTYNLNNGDFTLTPWPSFNLNFETKLKCLEEFLNKTVTVNKPLIPQNQLMFHEPTVNELKIYQNFKSFDTLLENNDYLKKIIKLEQLLRKSVERRVLAQPEYCKNCINKLKHCTHATIGVLFSGGIDCSILALLAHKFVDKKRPIDLINVAFENKNTFQTPDRQTSEKTLKELETLIPERKWNLVRVNVTKDELNLERNRKIADLIYPLETILDDSLGCALWFAALGKSDDYVSTCRVLLVGMGADELFGGYTRHRAALVKSGWHELNNVLEQDWDNLPHRNLGRDDRVISDHGRQVRIPYLDEDLVNYVRNLSCWERTYPANDITRGIGEKIMLRALGYHLGLKEAATIQKRALQFGSRIANPKENANDSSQRLKK